MQRQRSRASLFIRNRRDFFAQWRGYRVGAPRMERSAREPMAKEYCMSTAKSSIQRTLLAVARPLTQKNVQLGPYSQKTLPSVGLVSRDDRAETGSMASTRLMLVQSISAMIQTIQERRYNCGEQNDATA
jgi:hypothetical protein